MRIATSYCSYCIDSGVLLLSLWVRNHFSSAGYKLLWSPVWTGIVFSKVWSHQNFKICQCYSMYGTGHATESITITIIASQVSRLLSACNEVDLWPINRSTSPLQLLNPFRFSILSSPPATISRITNMRKLGFKGIKSNHSLEISNLSWFWNLKSWKFAVNSTYCLFIHHKPAAKRTIADLICMDSECKFLAAVHFWTLNIMWLNTYTPDSMILKAEISP